MSVTLMLSRMLLILVCALALTRHSFAQAQCGVVTSIGFPVDTSVFTLVQDYGASSMRHQGRYHTGEDWYGQRDNSLGQPVRAIANGRVTFSSDNGWGRDGGVVIIEHTFPDESTAYSVYGHMMATDDAPFPPVLTCVEQGDIVGMVGDVRPAPHVHFEIKTNNPNLPGAGYTWGDPFAEGWRVPTKFVLNWQTWLNASHNWHADIADEHGPATPPVELDDHSLIYLDSGRVGRLTPDGRLLWRTVLDAPAVGLAAFADSALILYADGAMQPINLDGALGEAWTLNTPFDGAPIPLDDLLLMHTPDNRLAAVDLVGREIRWTLDDVPPIVRWQRGAQVMGLVTSDDQLLTISPFGTLLDRALLREGGALTSVTNGDLIAYTQGGLWRIRPDGAWDLVIENAPPSSRSGAAAWTAQGAVYLFDGGTLYSMGAGGAVNWQTALPGIQGLTTLTAYDANLLLTSTDGHIIAVQAATGAVCNATQIYGDRRARAWHSLGADGVLRLAIADQILGLDWVEFLAACR